MTPWTAAGQAPLSVEQSRQECQSGLPSPLPGDLADPGTELASPVGGWIPCFCTSWEAPALEMNPPETAPLSQSVGSSTLQTAPKLHTATGGGRVGRGYTNSHLVVSAFSLIYGANGIPSLGICWSLEERGDYFQWPT